MVYRNLVYGVQLAYGVERENRYRYSPGTVAFIPYSFKLFGSRNFVIMYDSKCQSRLSFFNIFPTDEGGRNDLGGIFKESRWLNREPNIRENP
jgi:hypothetical protein